MKIEKTKILDKKFAGVSTLEFTATLARALVRVIGIMFVLYSIVLTLVFVIKGVVVQYFPVFSTLSYIPVVLTGAIMFALVTVFFFGDSKIIMEVRNISFAVSYGALVLYLVALDMFIIVAVLSIFAAVSVLPKWIRRRRARKPVLAL